MLAPLRPFAFECARSSRALRIIRRSATYIGTLNRLYAAAEKKGYWVTLNMRAQVDNRYVCAEIFANCLIANGQYGWKSHCSRVKMMRCDGPCSADYAKKSYPSLFAFHALRSCGWGGSNAHNTLIHVPRRQMFGSNVFISVIRA